MLFFGAFPSDVLRIVFGESKILACRSVDGSLGVSIFESLPFTVSRAFLILMRSLGAVLG